MQHASVRQTRFWKCMTPADYGVLVARSAAEGRAKREAAWRGQQGLDRRS